MDVAVDHFIKEWGGLNNALKAAEMNLDYWRSRGNKQLTQRYVEVISYLEKTIDVRDSKNTQRKGRKKG